ncbi:MAG TPA: GIY-YIG nuclease family protein [Candidatus Fimimorpha faecalis]|uniref:GIY-YIG nuclease family protein n=1 Tax=Candidatus Fimimorpha faecalis TaxID=2840824 RepID=A0A9D1JE54_9FIRM|nr:GIY-YIG nuclease family protein [Candidatus Fimimorpha faecalis]
MFYTYIVECSDHSFYTGWTNNLEKRIATHNAGKGAKYTKYRLPVTLVYFEIYPDKQAAMRREYAIKQLTRKQKLTLIANGTGSKQI